MAVELAMGVSYCLVGESAIVLELNQDRYFALPRNNLQGSNPPPSLFTRGILTGSGEIGSTIRPVSVTRPTAALKQSWSRPGSWVGLKAALTMVRAERFLRRHGLASSIHRSQILYQSEVRESAKASEYEQVVHSFHWIDRLFDQNRVCLTRSLAIREMLSRRSLEASLVIGVKLHPFAAHAWIQADNLLISDTLDRVRLYQPIASF